MLAPLRAIFSVTYQLIKNTTKALRDVGVKSSRPRQLGRRHSTLL